MNLFEKVMIKLILLLSSLFISIFLVIITLLYPVTVNNPSELKHVELGLPLAFFEQDLSRLNPSLPADLAAHSPLEYPFEVFWPSLSLNVLLVSLLVFVSPYLVKKMIRILKTNAVDDSKIEATIDTASPAEGHDTNKRMREPGV